MHKLVILSMLLLFTKSGLAAAPLKQTIEISAYGSRFQAERLKVAAENIANEHSTAATPGGTPYQRKIIFAENQYDRQVKTRLLKVKKITTDNSEFILKYDPNHPAADAQGYVKYPNIRREIERADAAEAKRAIEANLSMIEITNGLMQKTIEAIR